MYLTAEKIVSMTEMIVLIAATIVSMTEKIVLVAETIRQSRYPL